MDDLTAAAWMYQGQWVVDCPVPYCENVDGCPVPGDPMRQGSASVDGTPAVPHAPTLRPGDVEWTCLECGTAYRIVWPEPKARATIEKTVRERRVPRNRNWLPYETIAELQEQNDVLVKLQGVGLGV